MTALFSSRCADPECRGTAEPEQDGEHAWLECTDCGYAFAWNRVTPADDPQQSAAVCAVGIPESVRRAASVTGPPLLQIGRRDAGA